MFDIICVICTDAFEQTDDVFITKCGHMFHHSCLCHWLERSETCPQCREKCTNSTIQKVYFNSSKAGAIQKNKNNTQRAFLENAIKERKACEIELQTAKKRITILTESEKEKDTKISALEQKVAVNAMLMTQEIERLQSEVKREQDSKRKQTAMLKNFEQQLIQHHLLKPEDIYNPTPMERAPVSRRSATVCRSLVHGPLCGCELSNKPSVAVDVRNAAQGVQNLALRSHRIEI